MMGGNSPVILAQGLDSDPLLFPPSHTKGQGFEGPDFDAESS